MGNESSGKPYALLDFCNNTGDHNRTLLATGRTLTASLQALLRSSPDPALLGRFDDLGAQLLSYAQLKDSQAQWVGQVGTAFLSADQGQHPELTGRDFGGYYPRGYTVVTVSDQVLAEKMGTLGSTGKAQAGQLADAIQNHDYDKIRQLIQTLDTFKDDPTYTAAFFKELFQRGDKYGMNYVTLVLRDIHSDPKLLEAYDTALGTATRGPDWDPGLNGKILQARGSDAAAAAHYDFVPFLFKYGTYSGDFLTKAADMYATNSTTGNSVQRVDALAQILNAMAKDPSVAHDYLSSRAPIDGNNLLFMLKLTSHWPQQPSGNSYNQFMNALGNATLAADDADPNGSRHLMNMLGDLGWKKVPDSYRYTFVELMNRHPEMFQPDDSGLLAHWQRRFILSGEMNSDGGFDTGRVEAVQAAMNRYMLEQAGKIDFSNQDQRQTFELRMGELFGASIVGPLGSQQWQQMDATKRKEFIDTLTTYAFIVALPFAPEGAVVGALSAGAKASINAIQGVLVEVERRNLVNDIASRSAPPEGTSTETYNDQLARIRVTILATRYATNPNADWVPPELQNIDPNDGAKQSLLNRYLADLAVASTTEQLHEFIVKDNAAHPGQPPIPASWADNRGSVMEGMSTIEAGFSRVPIKTLGENSEEDLAKLAGQGW